MPRPARCAAILALLLACAATPALAMSDAESHDPANLTWIVPHVLAVGGGGLDAGDLAYLKSQGFGAVANFRAEHDDGTNNVHAAGMDYLYIPESDASTITEAQLEQFVAWAQQEAAAGKPMYIHCSNGWHRAPTFAIAYLMATQHASFDDAAKRVKDARDGVLIRAPGPLLAYQAKLNNQPGLSVDLSPGHPTVAPGAAQTLTIRVSAQGHPVAGAKVHVWTEEDSLDTTLTTDATGSATVTYHAPRDATMEHLFARASAPGSVDGAANPDVFIRTSGGGLLDGAAPLVALGVLGLAAVAGGAYWWTRRARRGVA